MLWDISYLLKARDVLHAFSRCYAENWVGTNCRRCYRNDWIWWLPVESFKNESHRFFGVQQKYTCPYLHVQICGMFSLGAATQTSCTWFLLWVCYWNGAGPCLCCLLSPCGIVLFLHGLQSWLALIAGPLPCVTSSQNGYSQWFYNHRNNLHSRNCWLSINSVMNQVK